MTIYDHVLAGCVPIPLAACLRALGVLRLVGEQVDDTAQGFWQNERFVLRTRLDKDELVRFFVEDWQPTPIVAPWNGDSGFWKGSNSEGLNEIKSSKLARFSAYRKAIDDCEGLIRERGFKEAPKDQEKADFISALRARFSDHACRWLDAAVALTMEGPRYPPILGTGGNDGRLDFSNNFMRRTAQILAAADDTSHALLRASLFSGLSANLEKGAVGQFAPGAAGGVNAGIGFESASYINPWDFVLTVEGALVFASAAVRRHARDRGDAIAFPFTTRVTGAGTGVAALADEVDSRAEFWTPLWSRPASLAEVRHLMSEGRAVLDDRAARNGFDFAQAAARLGFVSGIDGFVRYAFLQRAGKAYFATPLGRVRVQENPRASLTADLEAGKWLTRARDLTRQAPDNLQARGRALDDSLFRLAAENSPEAVQRVLIAFGALMGAIAWRPQLHDKLPPPPRLSTRWITDSDDGTHDFALAASLASLDATAGAFRLPFCRHLAPLDWRGGRAYWSHETEAHGLAVWRHRDLTDDMCVALERRLIEARRRDFSRDGHAGLPLHGVRAAPLAAIAAFLARRTDDARIAALGAGLAWMTPGGHADAGARRDILPLAWAALKPLFAPDGVGKDKKRPDPLPLVRLLRAGRVRDAIRRAQTMARGAGLPTPFAITQSTIPPDRLAAALLFPIAPKACDRLIARACPDLQKEEDTHAD